MIVAFMTKQVRCIQRAAGKRVWKRVLLGGSMAIREHGGEREPDTDDEVPGGDLYPYFDFLNPLWPLELCPQVDAPLDIVISFLGYPRWL